MVAPAAKREAVAHLMDRHGMSQRRACRVVNTDRASVRYQATRASDAALRERLKALAQERRRFGYRRLHVLLRREGHVVNKKRVQRLYREEKLTVRRRGGRKRALGTRQPIAVPQAANQRWSLDFVSDQMTDARHGLPRQGWSAAPVAAHQSEGTASAVKRLNAKKAGCVVVFWEKPARYPTDAGVVLMKGPSLKRRSAEGAPATSRRGARQVRAPRARSASLDQPADWPTVFPQQPGLPRASALPRRDPWF